jgi:hypothetical protein
MTLLTRKLVESHNLERTNVMERRSSFTNYTHLSVTIYEYKNSFFVLVESQQSQVLNPAWGSKQGESDYADLGCILPLHCSSVEIGDAVMIALDNFDTKPTPYDKFDFSARNRQIKKWIGYKGIAEFDRSLREVDVRKWLDGSGYVITPFDNNNINPWIGGMKDKTILLSDSASSEELGSAVLEAFKMATYHPDNV